MRERTHSHPSTRMRATRTQKKTNPIGGFVGLSSDERRITDPLEVSARPVRRSVGPSVRPSLGPSRMGGTLDDDAPSGYGVCERRVASRHSHAHVSTRHTSHNTRYVRHALDHLDHRGRHSRRRRRMDGWVIPSGGHPVIHARLEGFYPNHPSIHPSIRSIDRSIRSEDYSRRSGVRWIYIHVVVVVVVVVPRLAASLVVVVVPR